VIATVGAQHREAPVVMAHPDPWPGAGLAMERPQDAASLGADRRIVVRLRGLRTRSAIGV
jgi:hypothetical protein